MVNNMIESTILVVWLLTGQNGVHMEYAVRYTTEAQCQAVAKTIHQASGFYPLKQAQCVRDITK